MLLGDIKKLLENPTVQGVAGAAAFGANPLLGLLAGPGIKADRERRKLENDAIRSELVQRKRQSEARQALSGLLGDQTMVQGASRPVSGLEGETIGNIPGRRGRVPTIQTPEGQQQLLGLLGEVAPAQTAQGLLSTILPTQQRSDTSMVRNLQAAGIDPSSPQGRDIIINSLSGNDNEQALNRVNLELQALKLADERRKIELESKNKRVERAGLESEIFGSLRKAKELAQLNDELEGTFLETGAPAPDFRRLTTSGFSTVLGGMGVDTDKQQQQVENFDRFNKLATDFGIGLIERFRGTGAIGAQKFQALQQTMAGIGTSPGANRLIIADLIDTALDGARIEDIVVPDREELQALSGSLRQPKRLRFNPQTGQLEQNNANRR